jgi:MYXO-CTERM domain-containing protein
MRDVALVIGFVALCLNTREARAFCRSVTGSNQPDPTICPIGGEPLAWPGACASLSLDPRNVPQDIGLDGFRSVVTDAMNRWSSVDCGTGAHPTFHFVAYPDCPHGAEWNPHDANANVITFRTSWNDDAYHVPGAIAVTITTFNSMTGEIRDSDTELNLHTSDNPDGFDFTTGEPRPDAADLPTVITHELGHAQGLAHSQMTTAVMWFRAGLGEQRRELTPDDIDGICTIYPSTRSAACDPNPRGGFTCATGCGCSVPGSAPRSTNGVVALLLALVAWSASRRRRALALAAPLALLACNEQPRRATTHGASATTPADSFGWVTLPDGTLRPPDGPCSSDDECALRSDCGCGCFAMRTDFVDPEHRCMRCNAQVPFCAGARARCDVATRHCAVVR